MTEDTYNALLFGVFETLGSLFVTGDCAFGENQKPQGGPLSIAGFGYQTRALRCLVEARLRLLICSLSFTAQVGESFGQVFPICSPRPLQEDELEKPLDSGQRSGNLRRPTHHSPANDRDIFQARFEEYNHPAGMSRVAADNPKICPVEIRLMVGDDYEAIW